MLDTPRTCILTGEDGENPDDCTTHEHEPEPRIVMPDGSAALFVNVWGVSRVYGGPEEGGWWYDTGECIKTVVCTSRDEADRVRNEQREEFPMTSRRYSMIGGDDWDVTIDDEPGKFFPEERPHYE